MKETKESKAKVSKSPLKQGVPKGKSDQPVGPAPNPHALATVIAASVAASWKQGKNDDMLPPLSPQHGDPSHGVAFEIGERERSGEAEKQSHLKGKKQVRAV